MWDRDPVSGTDPDIPVSGIRHPASPFGILFEEARARGGKQLSMSEDSVENPNMSSQNLLYRAVFHTKSVTCFIYFFQG